MLDDITQLKKIDTKDALGVALEQPQQLLHRFEPKISPKGPIDQIVVAGMGGSALAAEILKVWPDLSVPITINRSYEVPTSVDESTLFIASSYSGNTEETLNSTEQALKAKAQVVVMCSGGKLSKIANENDLLELRLPTGLQPRMAFFYSLRAIVELLEELNLAKGAVQDLESAVKPLEAAAQSFAASTISHDNLAKQIAVALAEKAIIVYAGPTLAPAAYKWKISINENAKHAAWSNSLPEFDHNEFEGWAGSQDTDEFAVVELQSKFDHPKVAKRFELSNKLLKGKMPEPVIIVADGASKIEQILWTVLLGDFTSLYLAILSGIDPTPVELIEKLKKALY